MNRTLLKLQVGVLMIGTVFSWTTLVLDYRRFFASGGSAYELSGCIVANPITTPCFYGALAFLLALLWALLIFRSEPAALIKKQRVKSQRGLQFLLAAGTIFAWGNFAYEAYRFLQSKSISSEFGCPAGDLVVNPLMTPCFYGALIFLTALVVSLLITRKNRKHSS